MPPWTLEGGVAGFEAGFGGAEFGHVGFGAAGLALVEHCGAFVDEELGGDEFGVGVGEGEPASLGFGRWGD